MMSGCRGRKWRCSAVEPFSPATERLLSPYGFCLLQTPFLLLQGDFCRFGKGFSRYSGGQYIDEVAC
ncbi:MAG: hypothetical protein Q3M24_07520 [Candidatus Electrothrix aestuarii]|uniref:Uncharacterized protein n=1 Tax=Candidatus Electrothrix aestuarii TaxID=3062594 RepID=A0AAU8M0G1_9BACT|nr:hypothetical protein [Candidatus Electrothrix aestuarii]